MKTVTVEQFKSFRPCWLETEKGRDKFARIAAIKNEWTALDVLNLPDVSAQDKLWSVLRERNSLKHQHCTNLHAVARNTHCRLWKVLIHEA